MKIISSQPFLCGKNGKPQPPLPLQGVDANRSDDTLSLKISCRNAARTIRGGRFLHSTPLRFGRNDGGRGPAFLSFGA